MAKIVRGDLVLYKGQVYYYQPNGSNCYLYKNKQDIGNTSKKSYAPQKTSVTKYKETKINPPKQTFLSPYVKPEEPNTSDLTYTDEKLIQVNPPKQTFLSPYVKSEEPTTFDLIYTDEKHTEYSSKNAVSDEYVYVGKDITDSRHLYKIGKTINLKNRLRQYKTGQPNFEFIIKIKTTDCAKLETNLRNLLNVHGLHEGGENFIISINKIKTLFQKKAGIIMLDDGTYVDPDY